MKKILVCLTGASGLEYGIALYKYLKKSNKVYLTASENSKLVAKAMDIKLPKSDFSDNDLKNRFASGSNAPDIVIICPCSSNTMAKIANGISDTLITRAAQVCLKERKKLVLVHRETPLSLIDIENMKKITLAGGIILPANPGFYLKPKNISEIIDFIVMKVLNVCDIKNKFKKWR